MTDASAAEPSERQWALLEREYEESWNHYRHTEGLRSQYLGFFLTLLVAALTFGGSRFAGAYHVPAVGAKASIALLGPAAVVWFIAVSVRKMGAVLDHYTDVILGFRRDYMADAPDFIHIDRNERARFRRGIGIHVAAETLLSITALGIAAIAVSLVVAEFSGTSSPAHRMIVIAVAVLCVTAGASGTTPEVFRRLREALAPERAHLLRGADVSAPIDPS